MGDDNDRLAGCAGLYVDMENLLTDDHAMVQGLIGNWPDRVRGWHVCRSTCAPTMSSCGKLWATSRFPKVEVMVYGTQHLNMSSSKNSADIAMATHAMADLVLKKVTHVVVFSDDSDFISLYVAIWDDPGIPLPEGKVLFLWVVTDRENSVSRTVKQYFPPAQLHLVRTGSEGHEEPSAAPHLETTDESSSPPAPAKGTWV